MRRALTEQDVTAIWDGVKAGGTIGRVARSLGRNNSTVQAVLVRSGGVRPPVRRRGPDRLTLVEREELSRGLAAGLSLRAIAGQLGRSPSTLSREVSRNGGRRRYRAAKADQAAWTRAARPKPSKLELDPELREQVQEGLELQWSPEQIAGWLRASFPDRPERWVSHETIYLALFVQSKGRLRKELTAELRSGRVIRRGAKASVRGQGRGQIVDAISISERPAEAVDRAVPGHWEGDLLAGGGNTHIATLVERTSRFCLLVKVPSKRTDDVVAALTAKVQDLPEQLKRSLTWDRGLELAAHKQFTVDTGVQVYFCDPQSPWQRGTNENTNG
ncbi:MAG: Integrase, catalytic region, partial [Frankiales bacterium]|nr:Integrase, catalytic region [Frankiales bacterium]